MFCLGWEMIRRSQCKVSGWRSVYDLLLWDYNNSMRLKCDIIRERQELSPVRRTLDTRQRALTCSHCRRRWKEREGGPAAASGAEDDTGTSVSLFQQQHALKTTLPLTGRLTGGRTTQNKNQDPEIPAILLRPAHRIACAFLAWTSGCI